MVFPDCIGGVYGPPVILDALQISRASLAIAEVVRRFCIAADLPFNPNLMQPRGRPTVEAALQLLRDDSEYRSLAR